MKYYDVFGESGYDSAFLDDLRFFCSVVRGCAVPAPEGRWVPEYFGVGRPGHGEHQL